MLKNDLGIDSVLLNLLNGKKEDGKYFVFLIVSFICNCSPHRYRQRSYLIVIGILYISHLFKAFFVIYSEPIFFHLYESSISLKKCFPLKFN